MYLTLFQPIPLFISYPSPSYPCHLSYPYPYFSLHPIPLIQFYIFPIPSPSHPCPAHPFFILYTPFYFISSVLSLQPISSHTSASISLHLISFHLIYIIHPSSPHLCSSYCIPHQIPSPSHVFSFHPSLSHRLSICSPFIFHSIPPHPISSPSHFFSSHPSPSILFPSHPTSSYLLSISHLFSSHPPSSFFFSFHPSRFHLLSISFLSTPLPTHLISILQFASINLCPTVRSVPRHVNIAPVCSCIAVDGYWSTWSSWSTCSPDCKQHRRRLCDSPAPENGGSYCDGSDLNTSNCTSGLCSIGWFTTTNVSRDEIYLCYALI